MSQIKKRAAASEKQVRRKVKLPLDQMFESLRVWTASLEYVPVIDLMAATGDTPWQILAGTMLSARTKDSVTSKAVKKLFAAAPTPQATVLLSPEEIEKLIAPVGFPRVKAQQLHETASRIVEQFGGIVPQAIEELTSLPGVGVKTASLVRIKAFDLDDICVDTHVHRIANLWKLVKSDTPDQTRAALMKNIPRVYWKVMNQYLVTLGQKICRSRKHDCQECPVREWCPARNL